MLLEMIDRYRRLISGLKKELKSVEGMARFDPSYEDDIIRIIAEIEILSSTIDDLIQEKQDLEQLMENFVRMEKIDDPK